MSIKRDGLFLFLICIITLLFFAHLFFPSLSLFSTPDFGQSDIWQLNLPAKYFLSTSLKSGQWPLWNSYIGNGFPALAEGQIGTFNLVNLSLFRFLPFVTAYNLSYVFIFLTASIGTYIYSRIIKLSPSSSFLIALIFSFSGFFTTHISHFNLIQAAAFLPWLFICVEKFMNKNKLLWGSLLALVLSQQIFSGFPQITLISIIGIMLYFFFFLFGKKGSLTHKISLTLLLVVFISLGFLASSIQLLPQKEFLDTSTRSEGFTSNMATFFSYPPKHIMTFVLPFLFGNPTKGTYPDFNQFDGSIFWENTGYIGLLPLFLVLFAVFKIIRDKRIQFFCFLLCISFLLMTGKYSPLYFIYPFPPLSYFRVPSRFLFLFVWSLVILAGIGWDKLLTRTKSQSIKVIIITLALLQLFKFSYEYNPTLDSQQTMTPPEITKYLPNENARIYSFGGWNLWNQVFLTKGWQNPKDYLIFKNALQANNNILYAIPSLNTYRAQTTKRYDTITSVLSYPADERNIATPSALFTNVLKMYGINYLISPDNLVGNNDLNKQKEIHITSNLPSYKIYNLSSRNNIYVTNQTKVFNYISDFFENVSNSTLANNLIFVEEPLNLASEPLIYKINRLTTSHQELRLKVSTNNKGVLVFNNSFYPGWKAYLNGITTEIFPVNINQMGILLEEKENDVIIRYNPDSFRIGKYITLATYCVLFILFLSQILRFRRKTL